MYPNLGRFFDPLITAFNALPRIALAPLFIVLSFGWGLAVFLIVQSSLGGSSSEPFEEMFLDEARIASRIRHPNVAEIFDLGEENEVLYIVMEWVDGEPLSWTGGQVRGPRSDLYEALETVAGAHESPLSIIISTQAPTDADLLSVLIDDALTGADPKVKLHLFSADETLDPFSEKAIKSANPAYGDFLNAEEVMNQAASAKRMPAREAAYRNLVLNQGLIFEARLKLTVLPTTGTIVCRSRRTSRSGRSSRGGPSARRKRTP